MIVVGVGAAAASSSSSQSVVNEMWVFTLLAGLAKPAQISFGKWVFIFLLINSINSHFLFNYTLSPSLELCSSLEEKKEKERIEREREREGFLCFSRIAQSARGVYREKGRENRREGQWFHAMCCYL